MCFILTKMVASLHSLVAFGASLQARKERSTLLTEVGGTQVTCMVAAGVRS